MNQSDIFWSRHWFTGAAITLVFAGVALLGGHGMPGWSIGAFFTGLLGLALIALSVIDIETKRLPDVLTWPLVGLGLVTVAIENAPQLYWHAGAALTGYGLFYAIERAFLTVRGYPGLGRGDAKLLAGAGAWLGFEGLPSTVLVASLLGLAVALAPLVRGKDIDPKRRIAFGPFLAVAIWVVWHWGPVV